MRSMRNVYTVLTAVAAAGAFGCSGSRAAEKGAAPGPDEVVAEAGGSRITLAEVDQKAAGRLQRLEQEEYEVRKQALDELVHERLLAREAQGRGLTPEALRKAEVDDKVAAPTEAEVKDLYERNRARLGGIPLEKIRTEIERSILERRRDEREAAFRQELRGRGQVRVSLEQPRTAVEIPADAPAVGPQDARVTIVEFLDYQCPYCHRVQEVVDQVMQSYPGKLRFVHREFLLGSPQALPAARASRCAAEQGRFWEYHRDMLLRPDDRSDQALKSRAASLGLDGERFGTCLSSGRYDDAINQSVDQGTALGVTGTPTFFVNGRRMVGVRTLDQFKEVIDAELASSS